MGCQTTIASQILEQEADDILAVKNKQPRPAKVVRESFESSDGKEETKDLVDFCETQGDAHGRSEIRRCTVLKTDSNHSLPLAWESVAAMVRIESERSEGGKTTPHTRNFISSTWMKAKDFLDAIRQHWSIGNHLHGVLDVAFRADDSRLRAEKAAENFVVLKHMALNLLQNVKGSKVGIKIRRFELESRMQRSLSPQHPRFMPEFDAFALGLEFPHSRHQPPGLTS